MANRFLGSPVLLSLSDGSSVEGVLASIDIQAGTLSLTRAMILRDGFEAVLAPTYSIQRAHVKDIQVITLEQLSQHQHHFEYKAPYVQMAEAGPAPGPAPAAAKAVPGVAQASVGRPPQPQQQRKHQDAASLLQSMSLQPLPRLPSPGEQALDPAILSVGRSAHASPASSVRAPSAVSLQPPHYSPSAPSALASPRSARPTASSHASNSTVAARSAVSRAPVLQSPPQPTLQHASPSRPGLQQANSGSQRHAAKQVLKNKVKARAEHETRRFGGAETAGSEADESHVANSEALNVRRRGNNASSRPRQQFMTSLQPDDTEADDGSAVGSGAPGSGGLDDDFDFLRGLASFNKQAVFNEIREADRTDPSHRLVAHNKRVADTASKYTTKLRYDENVLEPEEVDDTAQEDELPDPEEDPHTHQGGNGYSQRHEEYYASVDDSSILPGDSVTEARYSTTDRDTVASGDVPSARALRAAQNGGRKAPASAMLEGSPGTPSNAGSRATKRQMVTAEGVRVTAVSDKIWKEVQQLCNIECGPNLTQRIENGARGIASVLFRELKRNLFSPAIPEQGATVVFLTTPCTKGSFGLRTGAQLVNHGATCFAYIPASDQQLPSTFEFHLRLFSAAGGRVVRSPDDLPENADVIVDALTDNETGTSKTRSRYDPAIAEAVSWALGTSPLARTTASPIYSVDLPSNTDPDSGLPVTGAIWSITPAAVIALGLLKAPSAAARYALHLVDIGIPLAAIERAGVRDHKRIFTGDTWVTTVS